MEFTKMAWCDASHLDLGVLFSDLERMERTRGVSWTSGPGEITTSRSWFEPMQVMAGVPDCRVADIAEALSITVGGASKLVDRIEHAGWCGRTPNPSDAQESFSDELATRLEGVVSPERLASFATTV